MAHDRDLDAASGERPGGEVEQVAESDELEPAGEQLAESDELDPDGQEGLEPPELDPEAAARRAAALAQVRRFGDPVLKSRALPVERFDGALASEVARMAAIMSDAIGIGLAATQVGVMHRVLVYRVGDAPLAVLVNPELEWAGEQQEGLDEGCLSLPGVHVEVQRPIHVRVSAQDDRGERLLVEASGLEARVIQHEIDHLDGVLILDRIPRDARKQAMRELREALDARAA